MPLSSSPLSSSSLSFARLAAASCALLVHAACGPAAPRDGADGAPDRPSGPGAQSAAAPLADVTRAWGVDFRHWNGMAGDYHFHEMLGPGAALADFDGDGDLDLFFVQGQAVDPRLLPLEEAPGPQGDRLYLNDLAGSPSFRDATEAAGLVSFGYGMGVATGDFDNDGRVDLYVTRFGANQLWRNSGPQGGEGAPRFEDVTERFGAGDGRWSTSAAFVDFDLDGWLDLYVVNYVDLRLEARERCVTDSGLPEYCGPATYRPVTDRLLRNLGTGAEGEGFLGFEDVSGRAGLLALPGPGLGIAITDIEDDGWPDLYIANDQAANHLWRHGGGEEWSFIEEGLLRGVALDELGRVQASMGVVAADLDADGDEDFFLTHLLREVNTLYINGGSGLFTDGSRASGLGNASIGATGFGAVDFDLDNDGRLDLVTVNGAVRTISEQRLAGELLPLRQRDQLFMNGAAGGFEERLDLEVFREALVGRGAAVGDLDNDGDSDLVISNCNARPQILENRRWQGAGWIGLRLVSRQGRDALGARVELLGDRLPRQVRRVRSGGSFLSAHDPRVILGLGPRQDSPPAVDVEIRWPGGEREVWRALAAGRYHGLREGGGETLRP
ncbi:MAG: CRTAC1 family protein [Acidobacteriota bacterium]